MLFFQGYQRISSGLEQTLIRRHILKRYCKRIKTVLREADAMCPQEKDNFLQRAKECIKDLENRKYYVLLAGKTIDSD